MCCVCVAPDSYYLRHDPSLKKPAFKEQQKENESDQQQQGVKRKAPPPEPVAPKVAVRKLSEAEIKKLQAKKSKKKLPAQSIGARKLVASQFKNMVAMPIVASVPGAATLESMAAGEQDEQEADAEPKVPVVYPDAEPEGDEPGEEEEGPTGSWLFKPSNAIQKSRDEDSD